MTTPPLTGLVCISVEQIGDDQPLYHARFEAHEGWGDTEWEAIAALAEAAGAEGNEGR
jgi:hypothetical protein